MRCYSQFMGTFRTSFEIGDPEGERWETVDGLVDTGASYTWMPRDVLERLGIEPEERWEFETADGRVIEREVAQTWARLDGA